MIIESNNIPPGLTGGVMKLLCFISEKPGSNCNAIAESLGVTASNITSVMDTAERCNLAVRVRKPGDRRMYSCQLTDVGIGIVDQLKPEGEIK